MQTISNDILKQAKKETATLKSRITKAFNSKSLPQDKLFTCPFCKYIPKNGLGTAKIFSKTNTFFCFCCKEWRNLENE